MAWMLKVLPAGSGKNCVKMAKIIIDREKCKGCFICVSACPKGLIKPEKTLNKKGVNPVKFAGDDECLGCCLCAIICPDCCIEVYK